MTTPSTPNQPRIALAINQPRRNGNACIQSDGTIRVSISGNTGNDPLLASVYDFQPGSGLQTLVSGPTLLTNNLSTSVATGNLSVISRVGPPKTMVIQIFNENTGDLFGHAFTALFCGSGSGSSGSSSGSGSSGMQALSSKRCSHCEEGTPIPVALRLQLEGTVKAGSCGGVEAMNRPVTLRHCGECSWLSDPIDLGSQDRALGFWTLEKTSAASWKLVLRRSEVEVVVTYHIATQGKDCCFPVTLKRQGEGSADFTHWPQTATASAD